MERAAPLPVVIGELGGVGRGPGAAEDGHKNGSFPVNQAGDGLYPGQGLLQVGQDITHILNATPIKCTHFMGPPLNARGK